MSLLTLYVIGIARLYLIPIISKEKLMLEQGKNEMNIIDLSKSTRTETEVKPVIFQSTLGLEEKPFTGRYPSLLLIPDLK